MRAKKVTSAMSSRRKSRNPLHILGTSTLGTPFPEALMTFGGGVLIFLPPTMEGEGQRREGP